MCIDSTIDPTIILQNWLLAKAGAAAGKGKNCMETDSGSIAANADEVTKEKLLQDLRVVVQDAEALIKATAGDLGEKTKEARARLSAALDNAKVTCRALEDRAIAGAKATDKIIREHPYQSIGIAFGVGLLIGVLVNRK